MKATPDTALRRRPGRRAAAAGVVAVKAAWWLVLAATAHAADRGTSVRPASPVLVTNRVLVTNVVIVTNYIVTTNLAPGTQGPAAGRTKPALPDLSWVPPADDKFDWIQLQSGEWLKGRIKAMQDRELEFDSEELEHLSFEWKDVRQVRSPRLQDLLFDDGSRLSGPIWITPGQVTVGDVEPKTFSRDLLMAITPGGARERNYWSGKVSLGLTLRSGNTEQAEYNATARLQRRTPATRFGLDYLGNYSQIDGTESANNHRLNSEFDIWLSRRWYLIAPFAEYYRDPFQNFDYRLTGGVGLGYDLIDRPKLEWNVTAGPAYQYTRFDFVQPGAADTKQAAALVFGSRFDWDVTRRIDLILEYRGQYTSREAGETTHHSVSTLEIDITKRFDLDISFVWDRVANPKPTASNVEPKKDDFRLIVGLGLDF